MDADVRLPFAPLERWLYARFGPDANVTQQSTGTERLLTDNRVGALVGRTRNVVFTWRHDGMQWWVADRVCTRKLGVHISEIWPDEHATYAA